MASATNRLSMRSPLNDAGGFGFFLAPPHGRSALRLMAARRRPNKYSIGALGFHPKGSDSTQNQTAGSWRRTSSRRRLNRRRIPLQSWTPPQSYDLSIFRTFRARAGWAILSSSVRARRMAPRDGWTFPPLLRQQ